MKKLTCLLVSLILLCMTILPVSAAESKTVYDLEKYMTLNNAGLIVFDMQQAIIDGFSSEMVVAHNARVQTLNQYATDGIATIDKTYAARIYLSKTRNGEGTYVDTSVWGVTSIYLSVEDTEELVDSLPSGYSLLLGSLISYIPKIGGLINIGYLSYSVNIEQIRSAAAHGTGIIISIHDDGTTSTPFIVVHAR